MSGLINKVKEAVSGHKDTSASTTAEPGVNGRFFVHLERIQPCRTKFDVDYDTSRTGHSGGLTGSENYTSDPYKTSTGHGQGLTGSGNYGSDNYGSDSQRVGNTGYGNTGYGSTDTGTRGPHSSNLGNKLDPSVDSGKMELMCRNSTLLTPSQMEVGPPLVFRAESVTPAMARQALDWAQLVPLPPRVHTPQT